MRFDAVGRKVSEKKTPRKNGERAPPSAFRGDVCHIFRAYFQVISHKNSSNLIHNTHIFFRV